MEWLTTIKAALQYIEDHLLTLKDVGEISSYLAISPSYLQQGFLIITNYNITEYIRNRRLYQAARALLNTDQKITDIALQYGYDNSSSFSKAFTRFHEASPSEVRKGIKPPKSFLPFKVSINISGGQNVSMELIEKDAFKVIGFIEKYTPETCHEISERWRDFDSRYGELSIREPRTPLEKAVIENRIGALGITEYPADKGPFRYIFGGIYQGGEVPSGLELYEIEKATWAVFNCVGKLPEAMEELTDLIWNHWVPGNKEYKVDGQCEFEIYYEGDPRKDPEYLCTKWIPVKKLK